MAATVDFCVRRDLVNHNFDHYQLSLDSLPSYSENINENVDVAKPSEYSFSSHHAKLFSLHNHLFSDLSDSSSVYLCDKKWNIVKISNVGKLETAKDIYQLPDSSKLCANPCRFNVSLVFPSPTLAVVSNGVDAIYICDTGNRASNGKWKTLHVVRMEAANTAIHLLDAVYRLQGENIHLDCLLASVEEVEGETKEKYRSPYITVLDWLTLSTVDTSSWLEERRRRVEGSSPIEYACLDTEAESVHVIARKLFRLVRDSVKPVDSSDEWDVIGDEVSPSKMYTWSQTSAELTVQLTIPEGVTKAGLSVAIGATSLEVGVKNSVDMIKGELYAPVQVDECTWTLDGRRLEITLQKVEPEMWSTVVEGDSRGELVMTADQIEAIHQRLQHLTSENWNDNPERFDKPFNAQMLEECDAVDADGNLIMRIDGETHQMSHKVIASNQFLFSKRLSHDTPPAFCLRHDVDGFLWQVEGSATTAGEKSSPWKHVGALNAFGYVLASKQNQRFATCSPDMSFAVVADSNRHIYLYRQKVSTLSPLRNRKTGQQVTSVAKQQVISLDCTPDFILGVCATNTKLFVATENQVFMYIINVDEQ